MPTIHCEPISLVCQAHALGRVTPPSVDPRGVLSVFWRGVREFKTWHKTQLGHNLTRRIVTMHSRFGLFAACVVVAAASVSAGPSGLSMPTLRRSSMGRAGSSLRVLNDQKGDDDDKHTDPEAYVHPDTTKSGAQFMTCEKLRMSLRGGAPEGGANPMNIVFVSAEVAPWSITGGLGAVCDGLPRALAKAGNRVMSIAPRYDQYFDAWDTELTAEVPLGGANPMNIVFASNDVAPWSITGLGDTFASSSSSLA